MIKIKDYRNGYMEGFAPGDDPELPTITATRFYETRHGFSGWVIRNQRTRAYSDPWPNKVDAKEQMRQFAENETD